MAKLKKQSLKKIASLMNLSDDLAKLNVIRNAEWNSDFNTQIARAAMLAFSGDVFRGLDNKRLDNEDLVFAQNHLRILSGLHGILRPLDLIRPYRLEMSTSIAIGHAKNLYQFWVEKVTNALNISLDSSGNDVLINLASAEYSKAVDFSNIKGRVITCHFKNFKNGKYQLVNTWTKLARGAMAGYIIRNRINEPQELKLFDQYAFSADDSTDNEWVFLR